VDRRISILIGRERHVFNPHYNPNPNLNRSPFFVDPLRFSTRVFGIDPLTLE